MLAIIAMVCGLGAWVCSILVGVKAINNKQTGLGVVCILCSIVGLIVGWQKQKEWGIDKNLMLAFTALFAVAVVLNVVVRVTAGA